MSCPVTVIFDGPKTAPLSIENTTTGEEIVIALSINANERLTVTTGIDNNNVVLTDLIMGDDSVAFQYIDIAETTFFSLAKGTNNIIITSNEGAVEDATIKYKNQYVGV